MYTLSIPALGLCAFVMRYYSASGHLSLHLDLVHGLRFAAFLIIPRVFVMLKGAYIMWMLRFPSPPLGSL